VIVPSIQVDVAPPEGQKLALAKSTKDGGKKEGRLWVRVAGTVPVPETIEVSQPTASKLIRKFEINYQIDGSLEALST
jgi:hypothetical protein